MTLLNQIRVYSGKEVLNEGAQSITDKAKQELENRKKANKRPVTIEDFKPIVEKMKGWSTEKINKWIEAHRKGTNANAESNYVPWADESLEMLKKALEEYGLDLKAGEVESRNFSPANRRIKGSNAYAYQDKINNKNAAKVSAIFIISSSVKSLCLRSTIWPIFLSSLKTILPFCFLFFVINQRVTGIVTE